jgi:collagenase-like PrtC family protease
MELSVAYNFDSGLIEKLAVFPSVKEIYGKLHQDLFGGGRSSYTLRSVSHKRLREAIASSNDHGIVFNYLLNGASLDGSEQTRSGQKKIRAFIAKLCSWGVGSVTVASPLLLRIIKKEFPQLKVRVSAFAVIDSPEKASQWAEMGADTLCISAIGVNRDINKLKSIRKAVACSLQLIVNASCLPRCAWELTHMNLLTNSSRSGHKLGGFCLDYCFFHCARKRLGDSSLYLRGVWIRPEDLSFYENLGYTSFKIVERSSPSQLLLTRVKAYSERSFDGNLMELVAPVAQIKPQLSPSLFQYIQMILKMSKLQYVKIKSLLKIKKFAELIMLHDFNKHTCPVYIDNKKLDGFLNEITKHTDCTCGNPRCAICASWAPKAIEIDEQYRKQVLAMAQEIDESIIDGTLW